MKNNASLIAQPAPIPLPYRVALILTPGFSMMSLSSIVEPLRGANRLDGCRSFEWSFFSPLGSPVTASCGLDVKTQPLPLADGAANLIVVCGGQDDEDYTDRRIRDLLRSAKRRDALVGGVSTGTFLLAAAGLLDGRRCTTHWNYIDAFRERYPHLDICSDLFVMDRRVFTCGGGVAAMDIMLEIIRLDRGEDFANKVAENFVYGGARRHDASQRMSLRMRLGVSHPTLTEAVSLMEANTETPLRVPVMARKLGISQRQLERLFEDHLQCTPARYYLRIRLDRAQGLLRHSTMAVFDIAVACGFSSATHFSRAYRMCFGCAPSADRKMIGG